MNFHIKTHKIYEYRFGSHAYGLNTETSDEDVRGIVVPPLDYFFGLLRFEQYESKLVGHKDLDEVYFDIRKFAHLACKGNPNFIEPLFIQKEDVLFIDDLGKKLLTIKDCVLSKNVAASYLGFASSQLHRMKAKASNQGKGEFRKELVSKFGYDTKYAMHLIRLLKMGFEILFTGIVNVKRADREELLSIRNGKYSEKEIVDWAEELMSAIKREKELSNLPSSPDFNIINKTIVEIVSEFHFPDTCWSWTP